ncbi:cytidine deaminase [Candidatus Magnetomorum sp. HK-1]|nr:cytidine deaminase [Candidatus Magnetomorum sp. HK-1]
MNDDILFMKKALNHAETALNRGDFPVGCILTFNNQIIATGERTGTVHSVSNELDHAEINALRKLSQYNPPDSFDTSQLTIYCTLEPCLMCFSAIMIHGLSRLVYAFEDVMGGGTAIDRTHLTPLYRNHNIEIVSGLCRAESLSLFKAFYSDSKNKYLADSYLANYILNQDV